MFGIGMSEMVIILAVALLVFGPNKLPEIAKQIAKGLKELRKAGDDLKSSVNFDLDDDRPRAPRPMPPPRVVPPTITGSALADKLPAADEPGPKLGDVWPKPAEGAVAQSEPPAEPATTPSTSAAPASAASTDKSDG